MLSLHFDATKPYRVVVYLRMSSKKQNERSPDQQLDEIKRRLKKLGYNWVIVKVYRDDAKSGRLFRKRPQFQQMLHDLQTGTVTADLILCDTIERFGRLEELPTIRRELQEKLGILILCADTNFADPSTPQGKVMGTFESLRATEDSRIKAHAVLRGKRDKALRKLWPGGPIPFGLAPQRETRMRDGKPIIDTTLVPDPMRGWIITLAFQTAHDLSLGQDRLADFLNSQPSISKDFKKLLPSTVGAWLENPIYKGVLVYGEVCTGIVDDSRVLQKNADEDILVVEDFCAPLVDPAIWDAVNRVRRARGEAVAAARKPKNDDKLIAPQAPGLCLKYPLTGLVRCQCGRSMTPSSSPVYVSKAGTAHRYVQYVCAGYLARVCDNSRRVPEEWLRQEVLRCVRERFGLETTVNGGE